MNVRVKDERARPGVQHAQHAPVALGDVEVAVVDDQDLVVRRHEGRQLGGVGAQQRRSEVYIFRILKQR